MTKNPLDSLKEGKWFKLICGASFQDLPRIRSLAIAYTLAGADCIDVAADDAVVAAVREAIATAKNLLEREARIDNRPWLMVSLNDGEDPHFRKAQFDPQLCPVDCPRPCQQICPTEAINFNPVESLGVIAPRCYGCGRCLPVCPQQLIFTRSYISALEEIKPLIKGVDAIEIHTQVGRFQDFKRLWKEIASSCQNLKLLAISCPDDSEVIDYLQSLYDLISPLPYPLLWQTDGRPMSGDIGAGTTHAAIKMAQKVLEANLPGFVQLAGGTNDYTVTKLQNMGLLKPNVRGDRTKSKNSFVSGIAYGSYARSLLLPIIEELEIINEQKSKNYCANFTEILKLENNPELLKKSVAKADSLVAQIKLNSIKI